MNPKSTATFPSIIQNLYSLDSTMVTTNNRLMVTIHSKDVPEILALYRMTKFDFPPHFLKGLMHSFPMMYNTMGSKLDGLAGRGHFIQKITLEMPV